MDSLFLRIAGNRPAFPQAAKVVARLKEFVAWQHEPGEPTDEEAFRLLQKITWLSLQRINQEEPLEDISPLADFPQLTGLCLWSNRITSVAALEGLTKLERLGLRGNRVADLSPLRQMSALVELEVQDNPVRDFSVLAHLPALRELEISSDQLSAFATTDSLPALWSLRIYGQCESLRALPSLPNLRALDLNGVSSLDGIERFTELRNLYTGSGDLSDLSPLSSLTKLTHLNISRNKVASAAPLARLFALRRFLAMGNRIRSVEPLARLPVLHEVSLKENPVSPADVQALERTLAPWDDEFADPDPRTQPALDVDVVSQTEWDYYDTHPFNAGDLDG
jgi:internalin A